MHTHNPQPASGQAWLWPCLQTSLEPSSAVVLCAGRRLPSSQPRLPPFLKLHWFSAPSPAWLLLHASTAVLQATRASPSGQQLYYCCTHAGEQGKGSAPRCLRGKRSHKAKSWCFISALLVGLSSAPGRALGLFYPQSSTLAYATWGGPRKSLRLLKALCTGSPLT